MAHDDRALMVRPTISAQTVSSMDQWNVLRQQAAELLKSGFLPEAITRPEQAVAIIMKGMEIGCGPMYSLSNIAVIKGKPTCNAEMLAALVYRDHGDEALMIEETTAEVCVISYKRRAWRERRTMRYTIQDARQAGITNNPTWTKYPAAMLRARCISAVARAAFSDSTAGFYTPEELGAEVQVDDDTGIVQVIAPLDETRPPAPALPGPSQGEEPKKAGGTRKKAAASADAPPAAPAAPANQAASTAGAEVKPSPWDTFKKFAAGKLRELGTADKFIDTFLELIIADCERLGFWAEYEVGKDQDLKIHLNAMWQDIRHWKTTSEAIAYASNLTMRMEASQAKDVTPPDAGAEGEEESAEDELDRALATNP